MGRYLTWSSQSHEAVSFDLASLQLGGYLPPDNGKVVTWVRHNTIVASSLGQWRPGRGGKASLEKSLPGLDIALESKPLTLMQRSDCRVCLVHSAICDQSL